MVVRVSGLFAPISHVAGVAIGVLVPSMVVVRAALAAEHRVLAGEACKWWPEGAGRGTATDGMPTRQPLFGDGRWSRMKEDG